jgi:polyribonucleotide nucleotidyltransferase
MRSARQKRRRKQRKRRKKKALQEEIDDMIRNTKMMEEEVQKLEAENRALEQSLPVYVMSDEEKTAYTIEGIIEVLGKRLCMTLELNEWKECLLLFDGKYHVTIIDRAAQDAVILHSVLCGAPTGADTDTAAGAAGDFDAVKEGFFAEMLSDNFFGAGTGCAALGLEDGNVTLTYTLKHWSRLSSDILYNAVEDFVNGVEHGLKANDFCFDNFWMIYSTCSFSFW